MTPVMYEGNITDIAVSEQIKNARRMERSHF
jgi:hypothetical protein